MRDHTRSLDAHRQAAAETIVYRQTLEHAIAMGDHSVVRRHPCPACHCYGLFWRPLAGKAACANRKCPDPSGDGLARTWSLAHLAHLHVQARKESSARHAT
ncbi:hypothetical protein [Streptomyces scabiei]|nr:hypothetical protein [Streptomyces scabiei]MDX2999694.1 hypothetical protein [Streptomyces scabiei]